MRCDVFSWSLQGRIQSITFSHLQSRIMIVQYCPPAVRCFLCFGLSPAQTLLATLLLTLLLSTNWQFCLLHTHKIHNVRYPSFYFFLFLSHPLVSTSACLQVPGSRGDFPSSMDGLLHVLHDYYGASSPPFPAPFCAGSRQH